jgi:hypothetical protein
MLAPPRLPVGFRALNAALRPLARHLPPFELREEALLAAARRATGLADFGDDAFRPGLRRFLAALESEARLSPLGRAIARGSALGALSNRLALADWRRRHPEIAAERIERPLVIIGMGRTGTTILHELLACDPRNRVPLTWEVSRPCPPPERELRESDPRIALAERELARTDRLIPDFRRMHPMGARLPQECVTMLVHDFASIQLPLSFRMPSYGHWLLEEADLAPAYRHHRELLQHLQWRSPGRWVLKSPCHLWHLDALLAEYPDAVLVQTHRDPLKVLASLTSLTCTLRALATTRIDPLEIAREWSQWSALAFERSVQARVSGRVRPGQVLDLHFRDFLADPFATLRRVYDFAGLEWSAEAEARMRAHLAANPADKHGAHRYRFADTGLDAAEERERVKRYTEYFDVPPEPL